MIFAKLDVCFWRHKRFVKAGPAACGYWAAALAYLQEDMSEDGVLEADTLGQLLGVGHPEALKLCKRLVDVGLFAAHERGYELLRYAEKNDTRQKIEARRAATMARQEKWRNASHNVSRNALHNASRNDLQDTEESVSETRVKRVAAVSESQSVSESVICEGEREMETRAMRRTEQLTDELRAIAQLATVQDVDGAWLKFAGHYDGMVINVPGKWQHWCGNEAKRERIDRERARGKPPIRDGPADPADPYNSPALVAERTRRQRADREAERDAVPAPMGALLGALGGSK